MILSAIVTLGAYVMWNMPLVGSAHTDWSQEQDQTTYMQFKNTLSDPDPDIPLNTMLLLLDHVGQLMQ